MKKIALTLAAGLVLAGYGGAARSPRTTMK